MASYKPDKEYGTGYPAMFSPVLARWEIKESVFRYAIVIWTGQHWIHYSDNPRVTESEDLEWTFLETSFVIE